MRKRLKDRIERRTLADGTVKVYRYAAKTQKPSDAKTVGRIISDWQRSPEWERLSKSTAVGYTRYIGPLYDAFKGVEFKTVRRRHLLDLRDMVAKKRGHGAAIAFCRAVSVLFKWAIDHEIVDSSPAVRMKEPLNRGTLPTWTLEQALIAENLLPQTYSRAVFLARHTAQRRGDLCRLRWSDYDGASLRLTQQKTKTPMVIPVVPELKMQLDEWKREAVGLTILGYSNGRPINPDVLSVRLPALLAKIGLPKGLNIHGLRKLAAVTLANAGCSVHEIAAMTGHKSLGMVQLYTAAADQQTLSKAAVFRLDKNPNGKKMESS